MLLSGFLQYQEQFDGHDAQRYFASHPLLPTVIVALYIFLVWRGQQWMAYRPPFQLKAVSQAWNVFIAVFSICGAGVARSLRPRREGSRKAPRGHRTTRRHS